MPFPFRQELNNFLLYAVAFSILRRGYDCKRVVCGLRWCGPVSRKEMKIMRNMANMAKFMVVAGCACALTATAFPPRMELDKAEKIVAEVMSSDVAAFNSKGKTAADVARAALKYVDEAEGEAARFLLLKGAFVYQVRAADYDGAKATIGRIRAEIDNVPDKIVADMLVASLRRVPRKHCGQLFDLLQRTQNRVRYAQEAKSIEQKSKASPADKKLQGQLGERYAMLGDWKKAVETFAAGDGKRAEIAQWEQNYPETGITELTTATVADFWWDAEADGNEDLKSAYRTHAAYWYRKAIENNVLPGLMKTRAEKRISEAEKDVDIVVQTHAEPPTSVAKHDPSQPPPRTLKLGRGADIEFVGCPAGSFMMGYEDDKNPRSMWRAHKVNITRPFWLSKFKVTHGMWNAYKSVKLTKEDQVLGGMMRVHFATPEEAEAFCEWATKRFRSNLPAGYVVRFPTNAEWEYACRANATDTDDQYVRLWRYMRHDDSSIIVSWSEDVLPKLNAAGLDANIDRVLGTAVGTKRPNAWGLYDMLGNGADLLLDRVDCGLLKSRNGEPFAVARGYPNIRDQDAVCIKDEETDPLWWGSGKLARNLSRGGAVAIKKGSSDGAWLGHHRIMSPCFGWGEKPHPFRLCIGPDLVKEKGFKK